MFPINWIAVVVAALIPMAIGFIWYNPKIFGNAWMKSCGLTQENLKGSNMVLLIGLSLFFSFLISATLTGAVIHQIGVYSLFVNQPDFGDQGSQTMIWLSDFMKQHGDSFRTFRHGVLHGAITGGLFVLPLLGTNALFERKGFLYIIINSGYWIVSLSLMGGLISAWK